MEYLNTRGNIHTLELLDVSLSVLIHADGFVLFQGKPLLDNLFIGRYIECLPQILRALSDINKTLEVGRFIMNDGQKGQEVVYVSSVAHISPTILTETCTTYSHSKAKLEKRFKSEICALWQEITHENSFSAAMWQLLEVYSAASHPSILRKLTKLLFFYSSVNRLDTDALALQAGVCHLRSELSKELSIKEFWIKHAVAVLTACIRIDKKRLGYLNDRGICYNTLAICSLHENKYEAAERYFQKALRDLEKCTSLEECVDFSFNHARTNFQLGELYFKLNKTRKARNRFDKCIDLCEHALWVHGDDPIFVQLRANSHRMLGAILLYQGRFDEARCCFLDAVNGFNESLKMRPGNATELYNKGLTYEQLGSLELIIGHSQEAKHYFKRAIREFISFIQVGGQHESALKKIAQCYESLVGTYMTDGDHRKAIRSCHRALSTISNALAFSNKGEDYCEARGRVYILLGEIYLEIGRRKLARKNLRRGLAIVYGTLNRNGKEPWLLARLGDAFFMLSELTGGYRMLKTAARYVKKSIDCYSDAILLNNGSDTLVQRAIAKQAYAEINRRMLDTVQAERWLREALTDLERAHSQGHTDVNITVQVGRVKYQLGKILRRKGEHRHSADVLTESIIELKRALKVNDTAEKVGLLYGLTLYELGFSLAKLGEHIRSERYFREAMKFFDDKPIDYGGRNNVVCWRGITRCKLAGVLEDLGRTTEIRRLFQVGLEYLESMDMDDTQNYEGLETLSKMYSAMQRYADALRVTIVTAEHAMRCRDIEVLIQAIAHSLLCVRHLSATQTLDLVTSCIEGGAPWLKHLLRRQHLIGLMTLHAAGQVKVFPLLLISSIERRYRINYGNLISHVHNFELMDQLASFFLHYYDIAKDSLSIIELVYEDQDQHADRAAIHTNIRSQLRDMCQRCINRCRELSPTSVQRLDSELKQIGLFLRRKNIELAKRVASIAHHIAMGNEKGPDTTKYGTFFQANVLLFSFSQEGDESVLLELRSLFHRLLFQRESPQVYFEVGFLVSSIASRYVELGRSDEAWKLCDAWFKELEFCRSGERIDLALADLDREAYIRSVMMEAIVCSGKSPEAIVSRAERIRIKSLQYLSGALNKTSGVSGLSPPPDGVARLYFIQRSKLMSRYLQTTKGWFELEPVPRDFMDMLVLEWFELLNHFRLQRLSETYSVFDWEILGELTSMIFEGVDLDKVGLLQLVPSGLLTNVPFSILPWNDKRLVSKVRIELLPALTFPHANHAETAEHQDRPDLWTCLHFSLSGKKVEYHPLGLDRLCQVNNKDHFVFGTRTSIPKASVLFDEENWRRIVLCAHGVFDHLSPLEAHLRLSEKNKLFAHPRNKESAVCDLNLAAEELCLLSCMGGASEQASGDEMIGMLLGWMFLGIRTISCCYWDIPAAAASYIILRLHDLKEAELSTGIHSIQNEMCSGKLDQKALDYIALNAYDLFGWTAPRFWIQKQLQHPYHWGGVAVWKTSV
jgi:tetratricopeptide (TPR) repeat protein